MRKAYRDLRFSMKLTGRELQPEAMKSRVSPITGQPGFPLGTPLPSSFALFLMLLYQHHPITTPTTTQHQWITSIFYPLLPPKILSLQLYLDSKLLKTTTNSNSPLSGAVGEEKRSEKKKARKKASQWRSGLKEETAVCPLERNEWEGDQFILIARYGKSRELPTQ